MASTQHLGTSFEGRLEAWIESRGFSASSLLIGVSGGADSVALLRGMVVVGGSLGLRLVVGHVDHGLRGEDSEREASWVGKLCDDLGVVCDVERVDTDGDVSEETARARRYEALIEIAGRHGCSALAVAHTRDDQVETVLHHIVRGTGLSGLRGMSECAVIDAEQKLIRPFLDVSRDQIVEWLTSLNQEWCEDQSNRQTRWTRNRIRHELIPALERDFNPRVREAVVRLARLADEADQIVVAQVERLLKACVIERTELLVRLSVVELADEPEPLIRACLKQLWVRQGWPRQAMGFDRWQSLAKVVRVGTAVNLPGHVLARRDGSVVRLECRVPATASPAD
ncbi:MAG: tRNA lysidine(34) synthetase TilS [Planctomycetaceae bacterium]